METLQMERVKREKELDMLRSSEPKLVREIAGLKESMTRMKEEMKVKILISPCVFVTKNSLYRNLAMSML